MTKFYCNTHKREATHTNSLGRPCCDPKLGGISIGCWDVSRVDEEHLDTLWNGNVGHGPAIDRHLMWLEKWWADMNKQTKSGMRGLGCQMRRTEELIQLLKRIRDNE